MESTNHNMMEQILQRLNQMDQRIQRLEVTPPETVTQQGGAGASGQEKIVAVRKNEDGNITAIKTNTGRILEYNQAIMEAKAGSLAHVDVFFKYGRDILRSEPDGIKENNLDQLPLF
jgi:hypothetical protein